MKKITIKNPYCSIYTHWDTISSSAVIYGYTDSTAEKYAKLFNRKFVSLGAMPAAALGDINDDGSFSIADAVLLSQYIMNGKELNSRQSAASDINKDGVIDTYDMVALRKILIKELDLKPYQYYYPYY